MVGIPGGKSSNSKIPVTDYSEPFRLLYETIFDIIDARTAFRIGETEYHVWKLQEDESSKLAKATVGLVNALPEKMRVPVVTSLANTLPITTFGATAFKIVYPRMVMYPMLRSGYTPDNVVPMRGRGADETQVPPNTEEKDGAPIESNRSDSKSTRPSPRANEPTLV